jgi:hypothetical protein
LQKAVSADTAFCCLLSKITFFVLGYPFLFILKYGIILISTQKGAYYEKKAVVPCSGTFDAVADADRLREKQYRRNG